MMTSLESNSNKRMRLDEDKKSNEALTASDEKLGVSFRNTSPDHLKKVVGVSNKRQKTLISATSSQDESSNGSINMKYQAALRRIVDLELKQASTGVTMSTSPLDTVGMISEDLVAARLQQMKEGRPLKKRVTWPLKVGGISEDLVAARLERMKQVRILASPAVKPTSCKLEEVTKPADTITSFLPICPTTNLDNSKRGLHLARQRKKQEEDAAVLKFARMIF